MIQKTDSRLSYVLITPARNEEAFIGQTIHSVISQTVLPLKWVIVSDGSTDSTEDVVKTYTSEHAWIELVRMPERKERHFAGKVIAFNAGNEKLKGLRYDIIGNLDADISFDRDYFEFLLKRFEDNPKLGVAGTPFVEASVHYDYRFTNIEHVSGACQLFRRECFEVIGGYVPLKVGGIDLIAVTTARMKGWETRTFTEKTCEHHRKMGTANQKTLSYGFKGGYHDYLMGVDVLWQCFRSIYQMSKKPYIVWGFVVLAGYLWAMVKQVERPVSGELIEFRKKEQRQRLKIFLTNLLRMKESAI